MSIFTFKAYDPGKCKFIDVESDNSKVNASSEAQQVSIPPSSGVRNASAGLLALSSYRNRLSLRRRRWLIVENTLQEFKLVDAMLTVVMHCHVCILWQGT